MHGLTEMAPFSKVIGLSIQSWPSQRRNTRNVPWFFSMFLGSLAAIITCVRLDHPTYSYLHRYALKSRWYMGMVAGPWWDAGHASTAPSVPQTSSRPLFPGGIST